MVGTGPKVYRGLLYYCCAQTKVSIVKFDLNTEHLCGFPAVLSEKASVVPKGSSLNYVQMKFEDAFPLSPPTQASTRLTSLSS